jgi:mono/diheme cytochrome c family protein
MHFRSLKLALLFCSLGLFSVSAQKLPDGEGKALVEKVCTSCHGLDTALAEGYSEQGWKKLVNTMIARGAEASDDEIDIMVKYLAKNFPAAGASNAGVNTATAKDISKKVPRVDAQKIDAAKVTPGISTGS